MNMKYLGAMQKQKIDVIVTEYIINCIEVFIFWKCKKMNENVVCGVMGIIINC